MISTRPRAGVPAPVTGADELYVKASAFGLPGDAGIDEPQLKILLPGMAGYTDAAGLKPGSSVHGVPP